MLTKSLKALGWMNWPLMASAPCVETYTLPTNHAPVCCTYSTRTPGLIMPTMLPGSILPAVRRLTVPESDLGVMKDRSAMIT